MYNIICTWFTLCLGKHHHHQNRETSIIVGVSLLLNSLPCMYTGFVSEDLIQHSRRKLKGKGCCIESTGEYVVYNFIYVK